MTIVFVLFATLAPAAQTAFNTVALSGREWVVAAGAALLNTFWIEANKRLPAKERREL